MIYIFLAIWAFLAGLLSHELNKTTKNLIFIISIFIFSLLSGARWKTGTDWIPYYDFYHFSGGLIEYINYHHFEIGYKLIVYFSQLLIPYSVFLFLFSLAVLALIFKPIKGKPYVLISIAVLMGLLMFGLFPVRQTLAVSLSFYACFNYTKNKSFFKFLALLAIAVLIHKFSLIVLIFPFLYNRGLLFSTLFAFFFSIVIVVSFDIVYNVRPFEGIAPHLYFQIDLYSEKYQQRFSYSSLLYKSFLFFVLIFGYRQVRSSLDRFESASIMMVLFGLIFTAILETMLFSVLNRFGSFFNIFEVVALPAILFYCSKSKSSAIFYVLYVALFVFYIIRFYSGFISYPELYYPYEFFFYESFKSVY